MTGEGGDRGAVRSGDETMMVATRECPECNGVGEVEYEGWSRAGVPLLLWKECETCAGGGRVSCEEEA